MHISQISNIASYKQQQKIMELFSVNCNISKDVVLKVIFENIKEKSTSIISEKLTGSNHHSAKLNEKILIDCIYDTQFHNIPISEIYKIKIKTNYNISYNTFHKAVSGRNWKSLNPYIEAAKEMKTLNYPVSSTVDDLIIFMKNNPKYQDTFYLDKY